jgi:hypothetical protein
MLELSRCITETGYKMSGHKGEEYNHISDPLIKNDEYTNYGHTERILMAKVLRDLIASPKE